MDTSSFRTDLQPILLVILLAIVILHFSTVKYSLSMCFNFFRINYITKVDCGLRQELVMNSLPTPSLRFQFRILTLAFVLIKASEDVYYKLDKLAVSAVP